jgi:tetratricopeptide (TPR) repeat protein
MAVEFEIARSHLKEAIRLDPSLGIAFGGLISIARSDTGGLAQDPMILTLHLLNLALKADPGTMTARLIASESFNPKWGGSFELLDQLLTKVENNRLKPADQSYLAYRVLMEKADHQRWIDKNQREAMRFAILAHQACSSRAALWLASEAGYDLEEWKTVRDLMTQSLAIGADEAHIYSKRGFASENLGDMPAAVQDYQKAIQLGQGWAMN